MAPLTSDGVLEDTLSILHGELKERIDSAGA